MTKFSLVIFSFYYPGIEYKPPEYKEHDFSEAPKFTTAMTDRSTTVGYSTKLLCSVRGSPKVRLHCVIQCEDAFHMIVCDAFPLCMLEGPW